MGQQSDPTMARSNGNTTPGASSSLGPTDPPGILRNPEARKWNTDIPLHLPHEKVFPIQIGTELFRLSGASLSSDGRSFSLLWFKWGRSRVGRHRERNGGLCMSS